MSKAVRIGFGILAFLFMVVFAVAVMTFLKKQEIEQQNLNLQNQLTETQTKADDLTNKLKKLDADAKQLSEQVAQQEREKTQMQGQYDELKHKADEFEAQLTQASSERDDWKNRMETIRRERDDLMEKIKNRPKEIVYKDKDPDVQVAQSLDAMLANAPSVTSAEGEQYWASILKEKAALQLELDKAKSELDQSALQVAELKKQTSDLQIEIKRVTNDKEDIERKIKYGEDLANNLSLEIARSRNDQKFVNDRADKVKEENLGLQAQVKQLTSTKVALEKAISRLSGDKQDMQKKLVETENVIQGRIDEIWQIKEGLDKKLAENPVKSNASMELPPIIVNANGKGLEQRPLSLSSSKLQGVIISINESNNFVITDLGQDSSPVRVGAVMKVIRESREVATLEVIQVRKDISAADIKQKSGALKVGDVVKLLNG